MSQQMLAGILGMDQGTLSRAERDGREIPPRQDAIRAANALELGVVQREELLAMAGYANTLHILEELIEYIQSDRMRDQRRRLTRDRMLQIMTTCSSAIRLQDEEASDSDDVDAAVEEPVAVG